MILPVLPWLRLGAGRRHRRVCGERGRLHVEVRSLQRPGAARLATDLRTALEAAHRVDWVRVNQVTGSVLVAFEGGEVDAGDVIDIIEAVEERHGVADELFPGDRPAFPGDVKPLVRDTVALASDVAAVALGFAGRLARLAPIPVEAVGVIPFVQAQPRARHVLERVFGAPLTDVGLSVANAVAQALAQGPLGPTVDGLDRAARLAEHSARRALWRAADDELHAADRRDVPPVTVGPRPTPLPPGPVEQYDDRVALASVAGAGLTLAFTRDVRRGVAALMASTPKAAQHGRSMFAAHLGRALAGRGALCLDTSALRVLDRVDCLVLDSSVLGTDLGLRPAATAMVSAARRAGHMVAVAGDRGATRGLDADLEVPGGRDLADAVRQLQADGCSVALVAGPDDNALAAADCGIGVWSGRGPVPWAADVIVGEDLAGALFLVEAMGVAHEVSRQSVALALGGSSVAGVLALAVPGRMATARAMTAVNIAALTAQANATRAAVALNRRRPTELGEAAPPWHALEVEEVFQRVGTSPEGLSHEEVARRAPADPERRHGPLSLPAAVVQELANPLTPVLAGAAALSSAIGSVTDAVIVASVAGVNGLIGGVQRYRVERAVRSLEQADQQLVTVRRNGTALDVPAEDVVVGDVVRLEAGDAVPADARVIDAAALEVDESALTGESLPVAKTPAPSDSASLADRSSMLYEATAVAAGTADAVVVATGAGTEAGSVLALARDESPPPGGVEARLQELTRRTLPIAAISGAGVVAAGLLHGRPLAGTLQSGVNLGVAAVPEGLPILATMAQLSAARRLARRGALVRSSRAIEALARVDVLCTDKTGTLTQGRIELELVVDGHGEHDGANLTNSARRVVAIGAQASPEHENGDPLPHLTDRAVVEGADRWGVAPDENGGWEREAELPFEPARGYHAVLGRSDGRRWLSVKGAPEVVLPRCDRWAYDGEELPLRKATRATVAADVDALARRGFRVLVVARREASSRRDLDDGRVRRLVLLGFLALADPVRETAASATAQLQEAGVRVVMLTGDHPSTAEGVAAKLGILNGGRILTGPALEELDDAALEQELDHVTVFARVTPAHKVRLVRAYQRRGQAVAMTGDGANDAPAIRLADVGIALGQQSTPAARHAADLIVADGRIETILDAIVEGRAMWVSVREALAILLGGNLGEIAFTLGGAVLTGRSPLNARQLLLVNLLTDVLPAMAIAVRPPPDRTPEDLLAEGPEESLGRQLDRAIVFRAVATAAGAGSAWGAARATGRGKRASTVGLAALIGAQLGQTLSTGWRDPLVWAASVGSTAAMVGVIQTPGLSTLFGCTPLGPVGWGIAAGSAVGATGLSVVAPRVVDTVVGRFHAPAPEPDATPVALPSGA
ncbi:MAG: HAD-IC family P-type ATPase [Acidimicrobiia bacterium]|nr:HAD-IC family P-type ATPase [Acidimicrobiia bacterium]